MSIDMKCSAVFCQKRYLPISLLTQTELHFQCCIQTGFGTVGTVGDPNEVFLIFYVNKIVSMNTSEIQF